jgi:CMP/dCMP kinase
MTAGQSANSTTQPARRIIVAIDGPSGAGKSTLARGIAERFGLLNLETGAMYRAFGLKVLRAKLPLDDVAALETLARDTAIELEPGETGNRVLLDGEDVTALLRDQAVSDAASRVSVFPPIRVWMVHLQQQMGVNGGVVMEGRDIGTVVFPHAEVKIFLDASPEVRGLRRYEQLGRPTNSQLEDVVRDLRERDHRDRNRADSPLCAAADAVLLDSTNMTLKEAVRTAEEIVEAKIASSQIPVDR